MAEPQDTPPKPGGDDLDARVAALEHYLATPQSPSSTSVDLAGGTIIHLRPFASFHITSDAATRAGIIGMAGILVFGVLFLFLCRRHTRYELKSSVHKQRFP